LKVSSNFERLLFEASDRDAAAVRRAMESLRETGAFDIDPPTLAQIRRLFRAGSANEEQVFSFPLANLNVFFCIY
jgi:threonine synthase